MRKPIKYFSEEKKVSDSNVGNLLGGLLREQTNRSSLMTNLMHQDSNNNYITTSQFQGMLLITRLLMISSGVILVGRYVYQFFPLFSLDLIDSNIIGIEIYDQRDLYMTVFLDTLLFIVIRYSLNLMMHQRDLKLNISDIIKTYEFRIFCEGFKFIMLATIFYLSTYWKLSISMFSYLFVIIWYFIAIVIYFNAEDKKPDYRKE